MAFELIITYITVYVQYHSEKPSLSSCTRVSVLKFYNSRVICESEILINLHVACESVASQSHTRSFCMKFIIEVSITIEQKQNNPKDMPSEQCSKRLYMYRDFRSVTLFV